jgi:hypothetical protein
MGVQFLLRLLLQEQEHIGALHSDLPELCSHSAMKLPASSSAIPSAPNTPAPEA